MRNNFKVLVLVLITCPAGSGYALSLGEEYDCCSFIGRDSKIPEECKKYNLSKSDCKKMWSEVDEFEDGLLEDEDPYLRDEIKAERQNLKEWAKCCANIKEGSIIPNECRKFGLSKPECGDLERQQRELDEMEHELFGTDP